ncbi:MAG: BtpA/SgcQ family protein [Firmicutes bacterium]|jgi:membrane complex biogenesis BtpA family protein|nr:BtpA/SgcQ family protein [Bacillota bacterium]
MSQFFKELIGVEKPVIAMVHFPANPGSPLYDDEGGMEKILESVSRDLNALQDGGVDAVMFCNEGDRPYTLVPGYETVASMARVIGQLMPQIKIPFGVDILWGPQQALALGKAVGARFVREIFTGNYDSDMGLWTTNVGETFRYRKRIDATNIKLFFNINAEFAMPLSPRQLDKLAKSVVFSSLADVLCVSGPMTGESGDLRDLEIVKNAVPDTPVVANTGVKEHNVKQILSVADGCIVGTALKKDGNTWNPVDPERVKRFMAAARG